MVWIIRFRRVVPTSPIISTPSVSTISSRFSKGCQLSVRSSSCLAIIVLTVMGSVVPIISMMSGAFSTNL